MNSINFESKIQHALAQRDYDTALELYADWNASLTVNATQWPAVHRQNAGSLARKRLYDLVRPFIGKSARNLAALENFVGLRSVPFANPLQQPSFFYFPGLRAQPFYSLEDFCELNSLLSVVGRSFSQLQAPVNEHAVSYVDHIGSVPQQAQWQDLRHTWQAQHLITGGKRQPASEAFPTEFLDCFKHDLIPNCPPFAPEVFISVLESDAYIPPHYGISNVKLTAHIPLCVSDKAWLKAGDEVFTWSDDAKVMIFDDSFLHSAKNAATTTRSVLIFDLWHPDLSVEERQFVQHFMRIYSSWEPRFGQLAGLDKES
ncbi:aspartyl/asparaginyl beta-hydroxylase domain-containing protein [Alteromonas sp. ASW11-36]|uniref:Aspartyl/asparaginyl beta-hydroxylase domain-containing protein n=1 Tax=Alteromonas arenosi TaxID=3055817 RepID=A0ABT7SWY6_9ALTE|nr:aspartyl/asparaginyl beta-hydroxylase domain-containing protein [Alteromonas sp. ASW11-36]MDM7860069.1 aspartyl/asparaginyl beta-hydroxylase domain-containing protein [Alteromonas sp. ASW11-36]